MVIMKIKTLCLFTWTVRRQVITSSSAVCPVDSFKVNLHEHTSIFTTEAVVLKVAVQHIQREAIRKSVIYSDSLSCLQTLHNKNMENPIIR